MRRFMRLDGYIYIEEENFKSFLDHLQRDSAPPPSSPFHIYILILVYTLHSSIIGLKQDDPYAHFLCNKLRHFYTHTICTFPASFFAFWNSGISNFLCSNFLLLTATGKKPRLATRQRSIASFISIICDAGFAKNANQTPLFRRFIFPLLSL